VRPASALRRLHAPVVQCLGDGVTQRDALRLQFPDDRQDVRRELPRSGPQRRNNALLGLARRGIVQMRPSRARARQRLPGYGWSACWRAGYGPPQ
jgi:hypothetical protein